MSRPRKLALDRDTALEDTQWEKLSTFLTPLLSAEDMSTVEDICRGGGDVPPEPVSGASDAAAARSRPRAAVPGVKYDATTFPDRARLK